MFGIQCKQKDIRDADMHLQSLGQDFFTAHAACWRQESDSDFEVSPAKIWKRENMWQ